MYLGWIMLDPVDWVRQIGNVSIGLTVHEAPCHVEPPTCYSSKQYLIMYKSFEVIHFPGMQIAADQTILDRSANYASE